MDVLEIVGVNFE